MDTIKSSALGSENDKMIGEPSTYTDTGPTSEGRTETKQEIVSAKHI